MVSIEERQAVYNHSVHKALWAGDVPSMRQLLSNIPDGVKLQDGIYGEVEGHRSASVYVKSRCGDAATHLLHIAASIRCTEMVRLLLSCGISPDTTDKYNMTALHVILRFLREYKWAALSHSGNTHTFNEILAEMHSIIEILIRATDDVNACDIRCGEYVSSLNYAIDASDPHVVKLLLDANADVIKYSLQISENCCSLQRLLMMFSKNAGATSPPDHVCVQIMDLLIDAGADVGYKNRKSQTPMHFVAEYHAEVFCVGTLVHARHSNFTFSPAGIMEERKAYVNAQDIEGDTPLHKACSLRESKGNVYMVLELLKYGANPFIQNAGTYGWFQQNTVISLIDNIIKIQQNAYRHAMKRLQHDDDDDKDPSTLPLFHEANPTDADPQYAEFGYAGDINYNTRNWVFAEVMQRFFQKIDTVLNVKHKQEFEEEIHRAFQYSPITIPVEFIGLWESGNVSVWRCIVRTNIRALRACGFHEDIVRRICRQRQLQQVFRGYAELNLHAILQVCIHECIAREPLKFKQIAIGKLLLG
jgi:ankyrin repeat protein